MSFIEYDNYKKKYENSMNNYSVFYEKIKVTSTHVIFAGNKQRDRRKLRLSRLKAESGV